MNDALTTFADDDHGTDRELDSYAHEQDLFYEGPLPEDEPE